MTYTMGAYYKNRFIEKVKISIDLRDWSKLPASFQLDVVKFRYNDMKNFFGKKEIKQRIAASKAQTLAELLEILESLAD